MVGMGCNQQDYTLLIINIFKKHCSKVFLWITGLKFCSNFQENPATDPFLKSKANFQAIYSKRTPSQVFFFKIYSFFSTPLRHCSWFLLSCEKVILSKSVKEKEQHIFNCFCCLLSELNLFFTKWRATTRSSHWPENVFVVKALCLVTNFATKIFPCWLVIIEKIGN